MGSEERDWTLGPAKWGAVGFLGGAAVVGLSWSIATRHGDLVRPEQPTSIVSRVLPSPAAAPIERVTSSATIVPDEVEQAAAALPAPGPGAEPSPDHAVDLAMSALEDSAIERDEDPATRLINVNAATPAELELLPGIGPALAARIIDDRERRGPFRSASDLERVRGIGPKTVEKLGPFVAFE